MSKAASPVMNCHPPPSSWDILALSQFVSCHEHGDQESGRNDQRRYGDREKDPIDHDGAAQSPRRSRAVGSGALPSPAGRQQGEQQNYQGAGDDQSQHEPEEWRDANHYRHGTPSSCRTIFNAVDTSATSCLPSAARRSNPASCRQVNFDRYSLGRCFSTKIRTSASVESSMTSGMMIGRGNGRDQFGAGRAGPHAKTIRNKRHIN
jgi:hypothetical protein